ncbi:hypothetical protein ACFRAU_24970 [Arthrobacter sp. NPDC056691]|uniref:hypothetical protein n=1 Tax=Arthrobacter sp. NPDC056691 TaxID=3345913 RepID=UPI0036731CDE
MPITSNVVWDARLETFKGRDTAHYIDSVIATTHRCAACRLPFGPGAALSLTVDITEGLDREGRVCLTFDPAVHHLQCRQAGLKVHQATGFPGEQTALGARLVLAWGGAGETNIPVLAYTLLPSLVFGKPGGEMTSALVSALVNHGFQLSFNDTYGDIVRQARPVRDTCTRTVGTDGAVELRMDGALMHSQQLDPMDPRDNTWLEAATAGHILVISGDNLGFTDTGLQLSAAAHLGTLVTGAVPGLVTSDREKSRFRSFEPAKAQDR